MVAVVPAVAVEAVAVVEIAPVVVCPAIIGHRIENVNINRQIQRFIISSVATMVLHDGIDVECVQQRTAIPLYVVIV